MYIAGAFIIPIMLTNINFFIFSNTLTIQWNKNEKIRLCTKHFMSVNIAVPTLTWRHLFVFVFYLWVIIWVITGLVTFTFCFLIKKSFLAASVPLVHEFNWAVHVCFNRSWKSCGQTLAGRDRFCQRHCIHFLWWFFPSRFVSSLWHGLFFIWLLVRQVVHASEFVYLPRNLKDASLCFVMFPIIGIAGDGVKRCIEINKLQLYNCKKCY